MTIDFSKHASRSNPGRVSLSRLRAASDNHHCLRRWCGRHAASI